MNLCKESRQNSHNLRLLTISKQNADFNQYSNRYAKFIKNVLKLF